MDIALTLEYLGFNDTEMSPSRVTVSYQGMVDTWRHPNKQPPSEAAMLTAWAIVSLVGAIAAKKEAIETLRDEKKSLPILSQTYQVDTGDLDVGTMATKIHAASLVGTAIVSITNSGGVATVTTDKNHHVKTDTTVDMTGADQPEYNVTETATRIGPKQFTYPIAGAPVAATGTLIFAPATMRFIPTTNEITFVDAGVFREIYLDVEEYVDACQINARELKNQVLAAVDVAAVDAIDITAGWPDTGL